MSILADSSLSLIGGSGRLWLNLLCLLTHWPLGDMAAVLNIRFLNSFFWIVAWALAVKSLSSECHRNSLMRRQHWLRWWLGAIRQLAITWANVDQDICCHMVVIALVFLDGALCSLWLCFNIKVLLIRTILSWYRVVFSDDMSWGGWSCEVSCGGHHRQRGKTTTAKRKDHHGVSFGWSSIWFHSNTGLSGTQYEQIPVVFGVWSFWLTLSFFNVNNSLAGLWLNCISSVEIIIFLLADILLQHRALFQG